jgi:flagellar hook assembly protein FlgD
VNVYNVRGQLVKTLANSAMPAGDHTLVWTGEDETGAPVASGIYFCRIMGGRAARQPRCCC